MIKRSACIDVRLFRVGISCFAALGVVAATVLHLSCEKQNVPVQAVESPIAVRTDTVIRASLAERISYVGTVHSVNEVKVLSQMAGNVTLLADEGKNVKRGEVIARLAAPEVDARLSRMEAEVQKAETESSFLCRQHETDLSLRREGVIPQIQVDASKRACDAATTALRAAQAGLREGAASKSKGSETAPFAGTVLQWLAQPGQNVMPGMPVLLLGSHNLELRVQVAERDLARGVREHIPAVLNLGGESVTLTVVRVAPLATGPGRTSEVGILLPDNPASKVGHGGSVAVDFLVNEEAESISVPEDALLSFAESHAVFVIEDGVVRKVAVTPGIRDGGLVGVVGDLSVGATVATSNLDQLRPGTHVFAVSSSVRDGVKP